jgi:ribonucleotide reductase beta subunit family protein with ferritin-like domain
MATFETLPRIMTPKETYTFDYPYANYLADTALEVFWHPNEINVEKDIQSLKTDMSEAEYHGVVTTLKLFTLYELIVGNEYWGNYVAKKFPRPEIVRLANCNSFFELNIHAPFYNKINEAMHLNTDEFYNSYVEDETLNSRVKFIEDLVKDKHPLVSLGVFSMVEGAILYSNFAFLKHFQTNGKNKLLNVVRGINFSVRDENIHAKSGAWLYSVLKDELSLSDSENQEIESKIIASAHHIYHHEERIIDMIFDRGDIDGINGDDLKEFVKSRINLCLNDIGIDNQWLVTNNPVADWFYNNINAPVLNDFFVGLGNQYNRNWNEAGFTFAKVEKEG